MPITEDVPAAPINPYGMSKLFMEQMLRDHAAAHGLHWVSLRYFNAAGADPDGETGEMHDPETHLIPRIFMAVAGDIPALELFGGDYPTPDGTCIRDYIHVADLASAHRLALEYLTEGGESGPFNLGTGKGSSVREVLDAAERACGRPVPFRMAPRRAGDPPELVAEPSRARSVLGWTPLHSGMDEIMRTAWAWFRTFRHRTALRS